MALVGYEIERQKIDDKIRELRSQLKGKRINSPAGAGLETNHSPVKRVLSAAARRRIAAAQRKRWAEHRRLKKLAAKAH